MTDSFHYTHALKRCVILRYSKTIVFHFQDCNVKMGIAIERLVCLQVFIYYYTVQPVLSKRPRETLNCLLKTVACLIEVMF